MIRFQNIITNSKNNRDRCLNLVAESQTKIPNKRGGAKKKTIHSKKKVDQPALTLKDLEAKLINMTEKRDKIYETTVNVINMCIEMIKSIDISPKDNSQKSMSMEKVNTDVSEIDLIFKDVATIKEEIGKTVDNAKKDKAFNKFIEDLENLQIESEQILTKLTNNKKTIEFVVNVTKNANNLVNKISDTNDAITNSVLLTKSVNDYDKFIHKSLEKIERDTTNMMENISKSIDDINIDDINIDDINIDDINYYADEALDYYEDAKYLFEITTDLKDAMAELVEKVKVYMDTFSVLNNSAKLNVITNMKAVDEQLINLYKFINNTSSEIKNMADASAAVSNAMIAVVNAMNAAANAMDAAKNAKKYAEFAENVDNEENIDNEENADNEENVDNIDYANEELNNAKIFKRDANIMLANAKTAIKKAEEAVGNDVYIVIIATEAIENAEGAIKAAEDAIKEAEEAIKEAVGKNEEAKNKAAEEAKNKAAEEAKKKDEEAKKKDEEAKKKAEEEAKKKAEEEAKRKAEEEAKRKAEEEAKRKAEEEAKKLIEDNTHILFIII